ncbi:hypothetical protein ES707_12917 [subsurface metagenome]
MEGLILLFVVLAIMAGIVFSSIKKKKKKE